MTMRAETTQQVASWQAGGVSVSSIERELSALWRPDPDNPDGGHDLATRTSVLNLVVYTEGEEAAERAEEIIAALADSHPSRALIVAAEPHHATASLDAALSAHCHVATAGGSKFCCEQVTITARGEAARHVAGVVSPLLLPDLPVVVWWQASLPEEMLLLRRMVEQADRLIVDAGAAGTGPVALQRVKAVRAVLPTGCALVDLAWTRLRHWRETVASVFDDSDRRPFVRRIRSLVITYQAGTSRGVVSGDLTRAPAAVALFIGWIEAACGVQPVVLVRGESVGGLAEGDLLAVEIDAAAEGQELHVVVHRDSASPGSVVQRVSMNGRLVKESRRAVPTDDESTLLVRELDAYGDDALYLAVLERAAEDAGPLGGLEGRADDHEQRGAGR